MFSSRSIHAKLDVLLGDTAWLGEKVMKMSKALDDLTAQEAATETAISAAVADIAALTGQVATLTAQVAAGPDEASGALAALTEKLKAKTDALNAAVNPPAAATA